MHVPHHPRFLGGFFPDFLSSYFKQWYFSQTNTIIRYSESVPSHLGMRPLHITLPSSRWHVMVSAPCVLMKPSSQTTEMELPSWKLSPKRLAFNGMPGSGHSLRPKACNGKRTRFSDNWFCVNEKWCLLRGMKIREIDVAIHGRGRENT